MNYEKLPHSELIDELKKRDATIVELTNRIKHKVKPMDNPPKNPPEPPGMGG